MKKLIDYLMCQVRKWSVWDFGVFKITLALIGIILGSYFSAFFMNYIGIVWALFAIGFILTMIATFRKR